MKKHLLLISATIMLLMSSTSLYAQTTVYVAGYEKNEDGHNVATLWVNGTAQRLSDVPRETYANSVFVSDSDVYVAGCTKNGSGIVLATVWKNGKANYISDGDYHASANALFWGHDRIYVAGSEYHCCQMWTEYEDIWNRRIFSGDVRAFQPSHITAGFCDQQQVYLVGMRDWKAGLWIDNANQTLAENRHDSSSQSVFVYDGDVYVAGRVSVYVESYWGSENVYIAALWKNGAIQKLSDDWSCAYSVYVSNGDVYVAGYENNASDVYVPVLWKNGKPQHLGNNKGEARSVCVVGNNVYVAGHEENIQGNKRAVLWVNGKAQYLSNGSYDAGAYSLFVK